MEVILQLVANTASFALLAPPPPWCRALYVLNRTPSPQLFPFPSSLSQKPSTISQILSWVFSEDANRGHTTEPKNLHEEPQREGQERSIELDPFELKAVLVNLSRKFLLREGVCDEKRRWSDLPGDVVALIISRLCAPDCYRFVAVCKSWSSIPLPKIKKEFPTLVYLKSDEAPTSPDSIVLAIHVQPYWTGCLAIFDPNIDEEDELDMWVELDSPGNPCTSPIMNCYMVDCNGELMSVFVGYMGQ
ncbi:hypothetical protein SADUNF_Sadunf16G0240000 [Salix dunnii]|uniref:F-box domain-containing protein n=1 Tax=Salix dunnii TaxID=1413687 RepID=A0A835MJW3_9ROSI|nr:hypothetical protein SADUNF_Sadunf16G0240000 [Salix dunnii]